MIDSIKDRPDELAPSLVNGHIASLSEGMAGAGAGAGVAVGAGTQYPLDINSSSAFKRMNNHSQYQMRSDSSPLSIALPLSIRGNGQGNGGTSTMSGPLPTGYAEHRRDTSHGLSHATSSSTFQYSSTTNNSNNSYDDRQSPPLLYHRPLSLSYANIQHPHHHFQQQQQISSPTSIERDGLVRRRRLSTASSSSKRHGSSSNIRSKVHNTPHHTRRFTTLISDQEPDTTYLWGYLLFFSTMIGFTVSMYALVASNYMPMTGNKTLDWIKQDSHYCMLVPITIPVTVLAVLFNWLGMKLFRHN